MNDSSIKPSKIPILIPKVPQFSSIEKYFAQIDMERKYTNFGPLENELRNRFSTLWNIDQNLIATAANATLAIQGAAETANANSARWELPSWTFAATPLALYQAKQDFSFVDIDPTSWRAVFSGTCDNIVDVLPFGDRLDLKRLENYGVRNVIIDGAASFFSLCEALPKTGLKYALVVSMHATKLLPAGEGAIFVSNCRDWTDRFRKWSNFGFDSDRRPILLGTNAKLSEYSAAVALASLDEIVDTRDCIALQTSRVLSMVKTLGLNVHPALKDGLLTPYWLIVFQNAEQKRECKVDFEAAGIEIRDWWIDGTHRLEIFRDKYVDLPNTDSIASLSLGLPFHSHLNEMDFRLIEEILVKYFL